VSDDIPGDDVRLDVVALNDWIGDRLPVNQPFGGRDGPVIQPLTAGCVGNTHTCPQGGLQEGSPYLWIRPQHEAGMLDLNYGPALQSLIMRMEP
jgi:hypothetical protein